MKPRDLKENTPVLVIKVFCLPLIITCVGGATFSHQICRNCWNGQICLVHFNQTNVTWPVARGHECMELCNSIEDCTVATLDADSYCNLYNCSQVSQKIGAKTFRKTNNSDCLDFEIYVHTGYKGNCSVIATDIYASNLEHCIERCLETPLCRSTSYDDTLSECLLHNICSDMQISNSSTFIERKCINEQPVCTRNFTQTCVNCGAMTGLCPSSLLYIGERKPLTINTSAIGEDPDVKQIWYAPNYNNINYLECSYVDQQIGNTVYRATCTEDCPTFEILTLLGHTGKCSEINFLSGGVTLDFCMDKCLDMTNCRGVSFNTSMESCTFHDCTNYTIASEYNFMARRCIMGPECPSNSTIIQTCLGCGIGPNCPKQYQTDEKALYTDCRDLKDSDNGSIIVYYNRSNSQCKRYQCSQIKQQMGHMLYRQSCNTDCPTFEIFQLRDYGGSCDIIDSEEGGFTFHYCIEKCLDINGCRGTTFNSTTGRCDYHTCSNHTASEDLKFMWKRCIDYDEEPPRDYQQICVDCNIASTCQMPTNQTYLSTWQECQAYFSNSAVSDLHMYDTYTSSCQLINCTLVDQDENMYLTVFRNSPSSDCPIFRLFTLYGYNGTCPVIGYDEGGVDLAYCIDKCLDMDGCRAVSHDDQQLQCFYHSCTERTEGFNNTFVKRECITYEEFNPTKDYIQTCKNCQNMCNATLSSQPNQQLAYNCETACADCTNIMFDPLSDQCLQYQCDRPYIQGPDCLNFELMPKLMTISSCLSFDYDEGVANAEFCITRCLEIDGCLAIFFDPDIRNCTYHACTDHETSSSTGILFIKDCATENECPVPVTQTCSNCQQGTLCQTPFQKMTSSNEGSCQAMCDSETFCEGLAYDSDNMRCNLYQCSLISPQYGSSFYRQSCNIDCPIYEVYILEGYRGSCNIIASMIEYMVLYPEICYERCLDTPSCRGVTYSASTEMCFYHSCDCYKRKPGDTFMWKYCLDDMSSATILPQFNSSLNSSAIDTADIFPTAATCGPEPIYIMPCLCSTGAFDNLTNEEIVLQLVENLTIDADSTSLNLRKYNCAVDTRPAVVVFGAFGLAILVGVIATVMVMDFPSLLKTFRQIYRKVLNLKKNVGTKSSNHSRQVSTQSIDSLKHYYAEDIRTFSRMQHERKLSIESIE